MNRLTRTCAAVAAVALAGIAMPGALPAAEAHIIIGIPRDAEHIVKFNGHSPAIVSEVAVVGMAKGEKLVSLDYRVSTNQLYAIGSRGFIYTIDITTGQAYAISKKQIAASLSNAEIDFHPMEDKLYVASAGGAVMRVDPDTGVVEARSTLRYDAAGAANGPLELGGIGFDSNYVGTVTTKLYGIDSKRRTLLSIDDAGVVHTVGSLQLGRGEIIGFDIGAKPNADLAFSPMNYPGEKTVKMYVIKRATGETTLAGAVGGDHPLTHTTMVPDSFRVYAVDAQNGELISFVSSTPGAIEFNKPITGLAPGEKVVGLNFRPATGELYGLGSTGRLYRITPTTAVATAVPGGPYKLQGTQFGLEFDLTGKVRIVSDAMPGLSVDPDGAGPAAEGNLGGPAAAIAFTNAWAGQSSGTAFALDTAGKVLKIVDPDKAGGDAAASWPLGVDATATAAFDICTGTGTPSAVSSEIAYVMLQPVGSKGSMLYAVPLTNGRPKLGAGGRLLSPIGLVGGDQPRVVSAMAMMGRTVSFDALSYKGVKTAATGKGLGGIPVSVTLSAPAAVPVTVDYATTDGTAKAGTDYEAAKGTLTFQPGDITRTLLVKPIDHAAGDWPKQLKLRLSHTTGPAMLAMAGPLFSSVVLADPEVEVTITDKAATTAAAGSGAPVPSTGPTGATGAVAATATAPKGATAGSAAPTTPAAGMGATPPATANKINVIMLVLLAAAAVMTMIVVRSSRIKSGPPVE